MNNKYSELYIKPLHTDCTPDILIENYGTANQQMMF